MSDLFSQPGSVRTEIYEQLASLRLVDPHTHINPHSPASSTLADLLGYHYYTELAHSAGMAKSAIEDKSLGPKELVERLVSGLGPLENTVQYSWLMSICRTFFGFDEDRLHLNNWEDLYDRSESVMASAQWADMVLDQSNVEAVFLTNDFDDDLSGFDTDRYIPCLRTDDLVFHLADPNVRARLEACSGISIDGSLSNLRACLRQRFEHFTSNGARACAISLPPSFSPAPVADGRAATALDSVLREGLTCDSSHQEAIARRVFWTLAELCDEFSLPFDLMIGVNRKVYPNGVFQGQDLFDSRVSLIQYRELFNAFPEVKFPVSVLASVTNQELLSYAWIFPNVYPNGHWWYSNTPSTIHHDLAARLEAVPQTKLIGYYSDAYKLEFVWPKFDMYRKVFSNVLAEQFVENRGWSVDRAVELGRGILKDNVDAIFPARPVHRDNSDRALDETTHDQDSSPGIGSSLGAVAGLAAASGVAAISGLADDVSAELDVPELEVPELEVPELEVPELEAPELEAPELEAPELEAPELEAPATSLGVDDLVASGTAGAAALAGLAGISEPEEEVVEEAAPVLDDTFDTVIVEPGTLSPQKAAHPDDTQVQPAFEPVDLDVNQSSETPDLADTQSTEDFGISSEVTKNIDSFETVLESPIGDLEDSLETVLDDAPAEPDPLPDDEEIGELDLDDVELIDPAAAAAPDSAKFAAEIDDEPLDVGDLLGEQSDPSPKIQPLRNEDSFAPDEESLRLQSDPSTGEFRLDTPDATEQARSVDDAGDVKSEAEGDNDEFNLQWLDEDED